MSPTTTQIDSLQDPGSISSTDDPQIIVIDFKEKSELFNIFFAKQFTLIDTGSELPAQILTETNQSLNMISFTENDILRVIRKLDHNKAHGHDQISIRMLQICDKAVCKPLFLIFSASMELGVFPSICKTANVVPAYKRDDKQNVKNY